MTLAANGGGDDLDRGESPGVAESYQKEMTQDQLGDWQEVVRIDTVVRVCAEILLAKFK